MDINFHYAAAKALAHCAGFSGRDSELIAYASQFVDDADAHERMALDRDPEISGIRFLNGEFDPICTAHKQIDYVQSVLSKKARIFVYVCFHFIPSPEHPQSTPAFKKVVKGGRLASKLVADAVEALKAADPGEEKTRALMGLGIALHSYADSWAHQGFSGYWDDDNNDIRDLESKKNGKFEQVGLARTFFSYAMPNIGHAEAGSLPDRSNVTWRCKPPKRSPEGERNCEEFLEAADDILGLLSGITGKGNTWTSIKGKLRRCFENPAKTEDFRGNRRNAWRTQFPGLGFRYDEKAWFRDALRPKGGFFDLLGDQLGLDPEDFEVLDDKRYIFFHAAAKKQRDFVRIEIGDRSNGHGE